MTVIKNLLFLDLDGVLNTKTHLEYLHRMGLKSRDQYGHIFDPFCVHNLNELIKQTGGKIVISSSWRLSGFENLQEMWQERELPGEIIGITPVLMLTGCEYKCPRGMEIYTWMEDRKNTLEVKNYVIIDDFSDMLYEQRNNYVQTTWNNGFGENELKQALNILK